MVFTRVLSNSEAMNGQYLSGYEAGWADSLKVERNNALDELEGFPESLERSFVSLEECINAVSMEIYLAMNHAANELDDDCIDAVFESDDCACILGSADFLRIEVSSRGPDLMSGLERVLSSKDLTKRAKIFKSCQVAPGRIVISTDASALELCVSDIKSNFSGILRRFLQKNHILSKEKSKYSRQDV